MLITEPLFKCFGSVHPCFLCFLALQIALFNMRTKLCITEYSENV